MACTNLSRLRRVLDSMAGQAVLVAVVDGIAEQYFPSDWHTFPTVTNPETDVGQLVLMPGELVASRHYDLRFCKTLCGSNIINRSATSFFVWRLYDLNHIQMISYL